MRKPSPDELRKLKDKAAEAAAKGKLDKAAELYREAADGDARDVGTRQKLAEVLRRAGRIPEAIQAYHDVAERFGKDGLLIKAIAISKTILELDPQHVETQSSLAELYAKKAAAEGARPPPRTLMVQAMKAAGVGAIAPPPERKIASAPAREDPVVSLPLAPRPKAPDPLDPDVGPLDVGPLPRLDRSTSDRSIRTSGRWTRTSGRWTRTSDRWRSSSSPSQFPRWTCSPTRCRCRSSCSLRPRATRRRPARRPGSSLRLRSRALRSGTSRRRRSRRSSSPRSPRCSPGSRRICSSRRTRSISR